MSETRPGRVERKKARAAEAILAAAQARFREQGYDATTVEEIAEDADVGVGTVYRHFGNKEGLHFALLERAIGSVEQFMDAIAGQGGPAVEQLQRMGEAYARFFLEQPELFRLLAFPQPVRGAAAETGNRVAERIAGVKGQLAEKISATVASGEFRELDGPRAAKALWASWNGIIALAWREDMLRVDEDELLSLLAVATDLAVYGAIARGS